MDAKFKEVCCNIRACLNSSKRQSSLSELSRDYHSVLGESIPYHSLGYPSLEALIRDVPQLKVTRMGNDVFIDVKPDEKTIHISRLVRDQKTAKKKSKKKPSYGRVYRGAPPPPRRSYNDPPKYRQSAPPPRSSDSYYPTRRREPPPQPPPQRSNHHSSYEDINEKVQRRYRSSQPSQYDFSDPNEFIDDEGSDFEDASEINDKMEALKVTLDCDNRQVKVNPKGRASYEDDIGYSSMRPNGYKSTATNSDSYEDYDDDDDYPSFDSTENSSSTTTDQLESTNSFQSRGIKSRMPFGRSNVQQAVTNSRSYSPKNAGDGQSRTRRGQCIQDPSTYQYSTNYRGDGNIAHVQNSNKSMPDIKVTVPNGSARARVVAFLLR